MALIFYKYLPLFLQFLPCCTERRRGIAMRKLSVCLSVHLSVSLSVKGVHCDKTEERSVQIIIPYERSFSLVFLEEEWLVEGHPFYLKFWGKIADFQPIFACSASAVKPAVKQTFNIPGVS